MFPTLLHLENIRKNKIILDLQQLILQEYYPPVGGLILVTSTLDFWISGFLSSISFAVHAVNNNTKTKSNNKDRFFIMNKF